MLKRLTALSLALLLVLALAACGGGTASSAAASTPAPAASASEGSAPAPAENKDPIELTFYYPTQVGGSLAIGMEDIVARFNEQSDWITVTPVYTGSYKQTAQKAMTDIAANQGPNVILSGMLDIVDYYSVDAVKDISSLIDGEGAEWKADFIEGFWGNFEMDGGVYGLPFQHSVCVLYYNQDMLTEAGVDAVPTNWEETLDAMAKLNSANGGVIPMEFPADVWVLEGLTLSNSGGLIKSKTETAFDSDPAVASLDFMRQMVDAGAMIQPYAGAGEDFVAESCAMMLNTTGNLGFVAADATFDWGVSMLPVNTDPGFSYGGGGLIMVDGQTPEEEEASWEFMTYMTSPEISAEWMAISGYFAVRKSSDDLQAAKDFYAANPQVKQAADLLEYTTAQWSTDSYWDVYAYMQTALDETLIARSTSAADALKQAQEDSMALLGG